MNKPERDQMREFVKEFASFNNRARFTRLLDYVDTLEAAAQRARGLAAIVSRSDMREIYMILSEALGKGE